MVVQIVIIIMVMEFCGVFTAFHIAWYKLTSLTIQIFLEHIKLKKLGVQSYNDVFKASEQYHSFRVWHYCFAGE